MEDPGARRFAKLLAFGVGALVLLPFVYGYIARPAGSTFLGVSFAMDDAMVYAAWMRQAMDGRILFDNRFAIDPQPGLTLHLYFLALGWIAKVTGIPIAMALARSLFSGLFVWLCYGLVRRVVADPYAQKLALTVAVFGAGFGFAVWHQFGVAFTRDSPVSGLLGGRLPVDVWQTEGFVFPSMLVNGLFVAALCLIVGIFLCVLGARESWKPVPIGAACFLLLMNIHSYDVLMIALVLAALLVGSIVTRRADSMWIVRVVVMALGAAPAALYFAYVLRNDPVFQARAATETYAADFQAVLAGYVILIAIAIYGFIHGKPYYGDEIEQKRIRWGVFALPLLLIVLFILASSHREGYWMGLAGWIAALLVAIGLVASISGQSDGRNLVLSWGVVGLVAPYFPALFQRKLAMGLALPWGVLAGVGLAALLHGRERGVKNLVAILGLTLLSGTSLRWFFRELDFIKANVSNTTLHAPYVSPNVRQILAKLAELGPGRRVVLAMPGIARPGEGPDTFHTPYLPDLNPIASGMSGAYSYAGHWSETPDYLRRRGEATRFFLSMSDEERLSFLSDNGIDFVIAPVPAAFPEIAAANDGRPLPELGGLGESLVDGQQFNLIRVRPPIQAGAGVRGDFVPDIERPLR